MGTRLVWCAAVAIGLGAMPTNAQTTEAASPPVEASEAAGKEETPALDATPNPTVDSTEDVPAARELDGENKTPAPAPPAEADHVFLPDAETLQRENQLLQLKLELAEARLEVETERAKRATALVQLPTDAKVDPDAPRDPLRFYAFNLSLTALTRNISVGLALRYLWAFQTSFTADVLLTPLISGLSLDDLDSIRFTAEQTVAWRLSMFPFKFMPRNVQKPAGAWPDLLFGAGIWGLLEADHLAQAFRLGDAGLFVAATVGPFIGVTFQDVTLSLAYRPFSIAAFFLDGVWDQRPFAFGNPVLDVAITWTLPL